MSFLSRRVITIGLGMLSVVLVEACLAVSGQPAVRPTATAGVIPSVVPTGAPAATPMGGGDSIAVGVRRPSAIVLVDPDDGDRVEVPINLAGATEPDWSPDGQSLVIVGSEEGCTARSGWCPQIFIVDADGSNLERLTESGSLYEGPKWSPDGTKIAFASNRDGNMEIHTVSTVDGAISRLTTDTAWDSYPAWSPDGRHIVFTSDRDGNDEIYKMDWDGSNVTRLTVETASDFQPAWSPDGSKIAFGSYRDSKMTSLGMAVNGGIYVMNADGSNPIQVVFNEDNRMGSPEWSPDGQMLAYVTFLMNPMVCMTDIAGEVAGCIVGLAHSPSWGAR